MQHFTAQMKTLFKMPFLLRLNRYCATILDRPEYVIFISVLLLFMRPSCNHANNFHGSVIYSLCAILSMHIFFFFTQY